MSRNKLLSVIAIVGFGLTQPVLAQVDAESVFKDNDCHKCHHATKAKKGPSLEKIAARFKAENLGIDEAMKHMTSGGKVKLSDGTEETHKIIDTKDPKVMNAVAKWMLDR
jgi:cytochrome c